MKYEKILIRFGELSLKGNNKMTFVRKLASNISKICNVDLKHIDIMIDRIFIPYSIENSHFAMCLSFYYFVLPLPLILQFEA